MDGKQGGEGVGGQACIGRARRGRTGRRLSHRHAPPPPPLPFPPPPIRTPQTSAGSCTPKHTLNTRCTRTVPRTLPQVGPGELNKCRVWGAGRSELGQGRRGEVVATRAAPTPATDTRNISKQAHTEVRTECASWGSCMCVGGGGEE